MSIHNILGGTITGFRGSMKRFMIDDVVLPPIVIQAYESDFYAQLKPVYDILWQAVGYSGSPPYQSR